MIHIVIFNLVQLMVALHAWRRGGAPERAVAAMMVAASVATLLRPYDPLLSFDRIDPFLFGIDAALLAGFVTVALTADRFWPMWLAALQLDAMAVHVLRGVDPAIAPFVYVWVTGQIAYPMIALLAVGTIRHRRRLVARTGGGHEPQST